jgi:hypothetical protein
MARKKKTEEEELERWAQRHRGKFDSQEQYARGDKTVIITSLVACMAGGTPIPPWLQMAFLKETCRVLTHEVASWDDAFGPPIPKGAQLDAARQKIKGTSKNSSRQVATNLTR